MIRKHELSLSQVYEHMTFDGLEHHRIANEEGMWERTITAYRCVTTV
jgi:hypothetical protein